MSDQKDPTQQLLFLDSDTEQKVKSEIDLLVIKLGEYGRESGATSALKDFVSENYPFTTENDWEEKKLLRYNYILKTLQNVVTDNIEIPDGNPRLRKAKAIMILTRMYDTILSREPLDAIHTVEIMNRSLESMPTLNLMPTAEIQLIQETQILFYFFEALSKRSTDQREEITISSFRSLLNSVNKCDHAALYKVRECLQTTINNTFEYGHYKLLSALIDEFVTSTQVDSNIMNLLTDIYYSPFTDRPDMKLMFRKMILNGTVEGLMKNTNPRLRNAHLSVLNSIVSTPPHYSESKELQNQRKENCLKILVSISKVVQERKSLADISVEEFKFYNSAYQILGSLLRQYVNQAVSRGEKEKSKSVRNMYERGLDAYLDGVNLENAEIEKNILKQIEHIIGYSSLVENPNHPFAKKGLRFYFNDSLKRIKPFKTQTSREK
ncbi:MAG: hypothetical protein AB9915_02910 [Candidatus Dojkabacteria bacterium]